MCSSVHIEIRRRYTLRQLTKKALVLVCALTVMIAAMAHPKFAKAESDYTNNDPTLIDTVENKYNGKLYVNFIIPANTTITYVAYPDAMVNGTQQGMKLQKTTDTITNESNETVSVTKVISAKYYGTYIVRASYGETWDEHRVESKLPYSRKTAKYTFTEDDLKAYRAGEDVTILFNNTIEVNICKEGKNTTGTSIVFETITYTGFTGDIVLAEEKTIELVPRVNYEYQIMYTPRQEGVNIYLLVYNADGKQVRCIKINEVSYANSGYRLRVL